MMVDMISGKHHRCGMLGIYDGQRWLTMTWINNSEVELMPGQILHGD